MEKIEIGVVKINKNSARKQLNLEQEVDLKISLGEVVALLEMIKRGSKGAFLMEDSKVLEKKISNLDDLSPEDVMLVSAALAGIRLNSLLEKAVEDKAIELAKEKIVNEIKSNVKAARA